jgi:hypothetical protein
LVGISLRWTFSNVPSGADRDHRVVQGAAAAVAGAFVHAADHGDFMRTRRFAQRRKLIGADRHRVVEQCRVQFFG